MHNEVWGCAEILPSNLYLRCFVRDQESLDFAQKWEKLRICFLFQRFFRSNEIKYDVEENVNRSRFSRKEEIVT